MSNQLAFPISQSWHRLAKFGNYLGLRSFAFLTLHNVHLESRTILDPASWHRDSKVVIHVHLAFFVRSGLAKCQAGLGRTIVATVLLQLQQIHPCDWQKLHGAQAHQIYEPVWDPGFELEHNATDHEMLNQNSCSALPSLTQHRTGSPWENR